MSKNNEENRGRIHVYTGDGKGKTTAALGLALRASGQGMKVLFIQFLKGEVDCGEMLFVSKHRPFEFVRLSEGEIFKKTKEEAKRDCRRTLAYCEEALLKDEYDVVILDEILVAMSHGYLTTDEVMALIGKKPERVELVLTGRRAPKDVVQCADYVTEMLLIKHPFAEGVSARRGVEY